MGLHLGRGDIASCTSQAADAIAVLPVMCIDLPNSRSIGSFEPSFQAQT